MKKLLIKIILAIVVSLSAIQIYTEIQSPVVYAQEKIKLNKTNVKLYTNQSIKLKVLNTKSKVKWTSSNNKIVTVSNTGKVTAKKSGNAYVYAKVNKKVLKCKVTSYKKKNVKKITLNKTNLTLKWGMTFQLKAGIFPKDASQKNIKFISSNPSVASINSKGVIRAKSIGTAVIVATSSNGIKARCKIKVINPFYKSSQIHYY